MAPAAPVLDRNAAGLDRVASAWAYVASSLVLTLAIKSTLTIWKFPSSQLIAIGQNVFGAVGLALLHLCGPSRHSCTAHAALPGNAE